MSNMDIYTNQITKDVPEDFVLESDTVYLVQLTGGSIGTKPSDNLSDNDTEFIDKKDAQAYAKRMNKQLSPGEKKYYKLKYKVTPAKRRMKN